MHWAIHILLALGPLLIVGLLLVILNALLRRTGGHAPGWQFRCTKCGRTRDAAEAGVVRIGAASVGKRVLGYCSGCHRFRLIALERSARAGASAAAMHA